VRAGGISHDLKKRSSLEARCLVMARRPDFWSRQRDAPGKVVGGPPLPDLLDDCWLRKNRS
jgi:hypothetical protein